MKKEPNFAKKLEWFRILKQKALKNGGFLTPEMDRWVRQFIKDHHLFAEEILVNKPPKSFIVKHHDDGGPRQSGSVGLYAIHEYPVGIKNCRANPEKQDPDVLNAQLATIAMRNEINDQVEVFRRCVQDTSQKYDVDQCGPGFAKIRDEFLKEEKLNIQTLEVMVSPAGYRRMILKDRWVAEEWRAFHAMKCKLQIITRQEHKEKTRLDRLGN